ncbi:SCO family protein [bacterium]|nr:SCO family protein [bacterium]
MFLLALVFAAPLFADEGAFNVGQAITAGLAFDQKLDSQLPMDARFKDHDGRDIALGEVFGKGPVVFALAYARCPNMCTVVYREAFQALARVKFDIPDAYRVVFLSIDPKETPEAAAKKRRTYLKTYNRPDLEEGTFFLTGDETQIKRVADAIGFSYRYDPASNQYVHPSGITVVTPKGRVSRYLFGIHYNPNDVRLAMVEASENKIGTLADHLLLFCYKYDPTQGRYGFVIMSVVRGLSGLTMTALGGYIWTMLRRERRARKRTEEEDSVRKV